MDVYTSDTALPIVDGKVYLLGGTVAHEGRLSWIPRDAEGYAPLNAYVLVEGKRGLVVDTSLPAVGDAIVKQLQGLGLEELSIVLTRSPEFDSLGNAELIAEHFEVTTVYSHMQYPASEWIYHREQDPESNPPTIRHEDRMYGPRDSADLGPNRKVSLVDAKLKLLAAAWVFDHATGTLMTSDAMSHVLAPDPHKRIITAEDDETTVEQVQRHLLRKFEWLRGARTEPVRRFVDGIFSEFDVQAIAPLPGCVLLGRDIAARHHQLVNEALERISEMEIVVD